MVVVVGPCVDVGTEAPGEVEARVEVEVELGHRHCQAYRAYEEHEFQHLLEKGNEKGG